MGSNYILQTKRYRFIATRVSTERECHVVFFKNNRHVPTAFELFYTSRVKGEMCIIFAAEHFEAEIKPLTEMEQLLYGD